LRKLPTDFIEVLKDSDTSLGFSQMTVNEGLDDLSISAIAQIKEGNFLTLIIDSKTDRRTERNSYLVRAERPSEGRFLSGIDSCYRLGKIVELHFLRKVVHPHCTV
jgi:hypothetical protein